MPFYTVLPVWIFGVALILLTPGPTNTLLSSAGAAKGFAGAVGFLLFEILGYVIAISLWGVMLHHLMGGYLALLPIILKAFCALYIIYLATKLWRKKTLAASGQENTVTPKRLFLATLANPKAFLFAGTLLPAATFLHYDDYLKNLAGFVVLSAAIGLGWVYLGSALVRGRFTRFPLSVVDKGAALVMLAFSLLMLGQVLNNL
ncbi:LysE family translocator [Biostraticola tofi]|uniref:Threonine/homoserine/homoserine lactone efflux protein n=1 Tax=Biostraticola tofi TaxID=466109 RepID=A0A4V2W5C8_9GAMM|nr:LysE family transporter [Biostraticola tofi]TCV99274.1 threonine/homoserine/homoserine lactone efflux protein [Biostraticola tofi]